MKSLLSFSDLQKKGWNVANIYYLPPPTGVFSLRPLSMFVQPQSTNTVFKNNFFVALSILYLLYQVQGEGGPLPIRGSILELKPSVNE